jgi:hypothetical protein
VGTSTQFWSIADGSVFLTEGINNPTTLNSTQIARLSEAMALWDDVSAFTAIQAIDDDNLAAESTTYVTEYFLGIPINSYWENSLPSDWTRVAIGDIANANTLGINRSYGANNRYHEVYIDVSDEGINTFQLGSRAFYTVIHEMGHSIIDDHITGDRTQTVMNATESNDPSVWYASTPMTLDIDRAIALFGATTNTRTGDDTYGFNAYFSGPYRAAFDFNINTRPLVTIFDNGGTDTLDASGFRDAAFNPRGVHVDLRQGQQSYTLDGGVQTFAVIYRTSWVENTVGGGGNDELIGNGIGNNLRAGAGNDFMQGREGNDTLDGGAGRDTAGFLANRASYSLLMNASGSITVTGFGAGAADGSDNLFGTELLQFSDGTFNLVQLGLDDFLGEVSTGGSISAGGAISGRLGFNGDHDWFRVTLTAGHNYVIHERGSASAGGTLSDSFLSLRNGAGIGLASDDDGGVGLDSMLTVRASATGTYYIDAGGFFDSRTGTYTISIEDVGTRGFRAAHLELNAFAVGNGGWTSDDLFPRVLADVNGDGLADIVGFGTQGVFVSLATGDGNFATAALRATGFSSSTGWSSQDAYLRGFADVNGDNMDDLIGFGPDGVYVSLAAGGGSFGNANLAATGFNPSTGWTSDNVFHRELADVDGNNMADIVGFGSEGVYVSLALGGGNFGNANLVATGFNPSTGWSTEDAFPRHLADVNGDSMADLVGFGPQGIWVSLATGGGHFGDAVLRGTGYNPSSGWISDNTTPRELADVNADGMADIVGFASDGVYVSLASGGGNFDDAFNASSAFGASSLAGGWTSDDRFPRELADVNGDQRADIIGFGNDGVFVSESNYDFLLI